MRKFGAAVAALAGVVLLGASTVAVVTAAQPGTTGSIGRLLSAEATSPGPSQASEQQNGSSQEQGGAAKGQDEHQQGTDGACTERDADETENQQGMDEAESQQGMDETCTGKDADEANDQQGEDQQGDDQQGMDEHGSANQSDVTEQR